MGRTTVKTEGRTRPSVKAYAEEAHAELLAAMAALDTPEAIDRAFDAMLTSAERRDIRLRWLIFKMLAAGMTQREISKVLGVSLCKITRGSRFMKTSRDIIEQMIAISSRTNAPHSTNKTGDSEK